MAPKSFLTLFPFSQKLDSSHQNLIFDRRKRVQGKFLQLRNTFPSIFLCAEIVGREECSTAVPALYKKKSVSSLLALGPVKSADGQSLHSISRQI